MQYFLEMKMEANKYAMGEIDGDLRQYTKEMNAALNGRGGGKPFFVQGSVQAAEDEIRNFENKKL